MCTCGSARALDAKALVVPDERTIKPKLVDVPSVAGCGVACVPDGTDRIEIQRDWFGQLEPYKRPAVVAHELAHILAGPDNRCEDCADRGAGAILHAWGYSEGVARALGSVVSSRPRAGRSAVEGWRARAVQKSPPPSPFATSPALGGIAPASRFTSSTATARPANGFPSLGGLTSQAPTPTAGASSGRVTIGTVVPTVRDLPALGGVPSSGGGGGGGGAPELALPPGVDRMPPLSEGPPTLLIGAAVVGALLLL